MHFPKYWAKAEVREASAFGKDMTSSVWRWSDHSIEEAQALADQAAKKLRERISSGETLPDAYSYGDRPVREEVIHEQKDENKITDFVITRTTYGSLVLNSPHTLFVDVDLDESPRPNKVSGFFKKLFRSNEETTEPTAEEQAIGHLKGWVSEHSERGARVYRTRGGLRYLITHQPFKPGEAESDQVLEYLNSDPKYRRLCSIQKSFRARLTPKPWRCGTKRLPVRFPYNSDAEREALEGWEATYKNVSSGWRTCKYITSVGNTQIHPKVKAVQEMHDQMTETHKDLPLA
ncbi:hypothetical protein [Alkalicoccobacillus murimartini]|uniref:Uncharacterized protein n=1 Tax=Alkalicoccobacillus murimartini TaxID=171685 RepID=A0ABT9YHS1_9BACI|nr:hypothetical protein [Alkalicoccobacillus murimartini]MDQ0207409.1 hypothetical protein [Alkalicoccobacillus murimartini]